MFSLRHLKVIVLIVGVLAVSFGMYVAFQVQEAGAHMPRCDVSIPTHILNALRPQASGPSDNPMHPAEEGISNPPEPMIVPYSHKTNRTTYSLERVINGRKTAGYTCDFCGGEAYISEVLRRTEWWEHETVHHVFSAMGLGAGWSPEFCHEHDKLITGENKWEIAGKNCYNVDCGG